MCVGIETLLRMRGGQCSKRVACKKHLAVLQGYSHQYVITYTREWRETKCSKVSFVKKNRMAEGREPVRFSMA